MSKFGRRCQLVVGVTPLPTPGSDFAQESGNITIPSDLTIEFVIDRQALGQMQLATFRIKNLGATTRNLIYKDPYTLSEYVAIQFRAGWASDPVLAVCFNGFILSATSYREGVDFITEIKANAGGTAAANGYYGQTVIGQSIGQMLQTLASSLPGTTGISYIGKFPGAFISRGRTLFGNTWNIMTELSGGLAFIDNGNVLILNYNEAILGTIPLIDSSSGLLGVPRRSPTMIEFDILFEPRVTLGQYIQLQSSSNGILSGTYKVMKIGHRGTVSPAEAGEYITSVGLFVGAAGAQSISQTANPNAQYGPGQFTVVEQGVIP